MIDKELNDIVRRLETVEWRTTMYGYLQWYYAEEGLYVLKCNAGTETERIVLIRARSLQEAIAKESLALMRSSPKP